MSHPLPAPTHMNARTVVFALALLSAACSQSSSVAGRDGGTGGAGDADTVDPLSEAIAEVVDVWEESSSAYIEFGCACRGVTCLNIDFWRPFATCVEGLLGDNLEARREFADVVACYADGFTAVEACVETATCENVLDECGRDRNCVYTRCDVDLSQTLEDVFAACNVLGAGVPGGLGDIEDCR